MTLFILLRRGLFIIFVAHGAFGVIPPEHFLNTSQSAALVEMAVGDDVTPECRQHWYQLLTHSKSFRRQVEMTVVYLRHPIYVVGSSWPETFQDCLDLQIERGTGKGSTGAVGQYCIAYFLHPTTEQYTYEERLIGTDQYPLLSHAETIPNLGVCIPSSCSSQDLKIVFEELVKDLQWNVSIKVPKDYCQTKNTQPRPTALTYCVLLVIVIVCLIVIVGTAVDWWIDWRLQTAYVPLHTTNGQAAKSNEFHLANGVRYTNGKEKKGDDAARDSIMMDILRCFSIYTNGPALLTAEEPPGSIGTLHGMRFISMMAMISAHTIATSLPFSYKNNNDLDNDNNILAQMVQNTVLFNDTFFFISGFLAAFVHLKKMKSNGGNLGIISFYWYRYLRLTPPYAFFLALTMGVLVLYSGSPRWPHFVQEVEHCKENWWLNLLYVNNIFRTEKMCQLHFWYLATDMQLHLLAPLLLYPLFRYPRFGISLALCCLAMSNITHGWLTYLYDLPASAFIFANVKGETIFKYLTLVHFPAYIKLGAYATGMIVGRWILLYGNKIKINPILAIALWPPVLVLVFGISMFALGRWYNPGRVPPTRFETILYNSTSRALWACCLTWMVVTHHIGRGGIVTRFLSWRVFTPLSKLTYCVYIIHYNVLFIFFYSQQIPLEYNKWNVYTYFAGSLLTSYLLAIPFALCFEIPSLRLVKLWEKKHGR